MRQFGEPADGVDQGIDIHAGPAAKPRQQGMALQRCQHLSSTPLANWGKPHRGVTKQFDHDSPKPGRNQRTELAVVLDAKHDFDSRRHHLLHTDAIDPRLRCVASSRCQNIRCRRAHLFLHRKPEPDAADLGLVDNVR